MAVVGDVVVVDYSELVGETTEALREKIAKAFGYDGLGLIAIRNVPGVAEARAQLLPYAHKFGNLPTEVKGKYELPEAFYAFGWSHGKEKVEGNKFDTAKGSFYFNPVTDTPVDPVADAELVKAHPTFCHPNIWPSEEDCPGMAAASKLCGKLVVDAGERLALHCDNYVRSVDPTYGSTWALANVIAKARCHKARLLYYFPYEAPVEAAAAETEGGAGGAAAPGTPVPSPKAGDDFSSWCGWHNDHGSLTGLTPAMFFNKEGEPIPCPDPEAGLYIRARTGQTVKAVIPPDCVAFQIGETAQVHTGGVLQATPHCVRAAEVEGVSRGTLAVFMEPEWDAAMEAPEGAKPDTILRGARGELLPRGVPPLVARWQGKEQNFGDFSTLTYSMYH